MPRTKSDVQSMHAAVSQDQFKTGESARVWWPPTDDEEKTDYAGMFWPVKILSVRGTRVAVQYDNGEEETVQSEHLQPAEPPVDFGKEAVSLQVCLMRCPGGYGRLRASGCGRPRSEGSLLLCRQAWADLLRSPNGPASAHSPARHEAQVHGKRDDAASDAHAGR